MNLLGILCAIPRFFQFPGAAPAFPLNLLAGMYDGNHVGTIVMNLLWVCFNLVILGVATSVAWESRQRRQTVRLAMTVPADVHLANGSIIHGVTTDVSSGGLMIRMERDFIASPGDAIKLTLPVLDGNATLPATLVGISGNILRAQFDPLTLQEEEALTMVLYSRADTWLGWGETREARQAAHQPRHGSSNSPSTASNKALREADEIKERLRLTQTRHQHRAARSPRCSLAPPASPNPAIAQTSASAKLPSPPPPPPPLRQHPHSLRPRRPRHHRPARRRRLQHRPLLAAANATRQNRDPAPALSRSRPPHPVSQPSQVSLNGTLFATLPVTHAQPPAVQSPNPAANRQTPRTAKTTRCWRSTLTLPAELLAHSNELTFEFIGHYAPKCEDPSHSTLWAHIDNNSTIEFAGSLHPAPGRSQAAPRALLRLQRQSPPVIPIAFLTQPSPKALQAAGIVASWFGILADSRPIRFPVSIGTIPAGNAIVIGETGSRPFPPRSR